MTPVRPTTARRGNKRTAAVVEGQDAKDSKQQTGKRPRLGVQQGSVTAAVPTAPAAQHQQPAVVSAASLNQHGSNDDIIVAPLMANGRQQQAVPQAQQPSILSGSIINFKAFRRKGQSSQTVAPAAVIPMISHAKEMQAPETDSFLK